MRTPTIPPIDPLRTLDRGMPNTGPPIALNEPPGASTVKKRSMPLLLAIPAQVRTDRATLTLLSGMAAGASFALMRSRPTLIGRGEDADVVIDDTAISRHHAHVYRAVTGHYIIEDLQSTNGTFVNGQRVQRVMLSSGFRVQLGPECVLRFAVVDETEETLQRRLYEGTIFDSLTGAYNRKYLFERLQSEVTRVQRSGEGLSVLMLDVDHFKAVNDNHGHAEGDRVLCEIAKIVRGVMRASDIFARYGGEEFAVLARTRDHGEALALAERVRRAVESGGFAPQSATAKVTVSIGVASISECAPRGDGRELVGIADRRLYGAKEAGRNQVCSEGFTFEV
jgi:two-component system cell cycle response regulator